MVDLDWTMAFSPASFFFLLSVLSSVLTKILLLLQ